MNPFTVSGCLIEMIGLAFAIIVYPFLTFAIENRWCSKGQQDDGLKKRFPKSIIQEQPEDVEMTMFKKDEAIQKEEERAKRILTG